MNVTDRRPVHGLSREAVERPSAQLVCVHSPAGHPVSALYALLASLSFGVGDFGATLGARRHQPLVVAFVAQLLGLIGALALAPIISPHLPPAAQMAWAGSAGVVGAAAFIVFLWSLGNGPVGVVAPVSAVISVVVPVVVGVVSGERPKTLAWIGMGCAAAAIVLLSGARTTVTVSRRVVLGSVATGLGFGVFFVLFSHARAAEGLWPVAVARVASVSTELALLIATRNWRRRTIGSALRDPSVAIAGLLDTTANSLALLAFRHGELSIAAVLISMYPASTVLLARFVLREHLVRHQLIGLAVAGVAIALVAGG